MSHVNCCVVGCSNTREKIKTSSSKGTFYSFSKKKWNEERMKIWIRFVNRKDSNGQPWVPTRHSRICSVHFIGNSKSEDPLSPSYNPTIYPGQSNKVDNSIMKLNRYKRLKNRNAAKIIQSQNTQESVPVKINKNEPHFHSENSDEEDMMESEISSPPNEATQVTSSASGPDQQSSIFCGFDSVKDDEEKLQSLTEVSLNVFNLLLSLLPPETVRKHEMTWPNKLLLFLMKLKTNLTFPALSTIFDVSETTVSEAFHCILYILYDRTIEWIIWPSRETIDSTLPSSFQIHYPKCRVIIDCTEIESDRPVTIEQQNHMYSNCKGTWTVKFLIGIAPCGQIIFTSKGYGGMSSDVFVTTDCKILEKLEPGDLVLADKRFPNLLKKDKTLLVMPPFAERDQNQPKPEQQMESTHNIASVRVHVERATQRLKTFNVLTDKLTLDLLLCIDEIMHVCSILVNLQPPIVEKQ